MIRRISIDTRPLAGASGVRGIGTYVRGLLGGLTGLGRAADLEALGWRNQHPPDDLTRLGIATRTTVPRLKRRIQPLADAALVSLALRGSRPGIHHATEWAQPLRAPCPVVVTVHDLIPFLYPQDHPWMRRERLVALRQLRHADAVVTPSAATARDCVRIGHVDPERITVIPHGVDPVFAPPRASAVEGLRTRLHIHRPYILSVGTLDPRKRRHLLLEVLARVRAEADIELVICGDQGSYGPPLEAALRDTGLVLDTRVVDHLSVDDLVTLYGGAAALVMTSAYEGFGLTVLEALACGTAVVTGDASALPEVAGDAAASVPDGDAGAMAAAVLDVLAEGTTDRQARSSRGESWARTFTWDRSAHAHLDLYTSLT